MKISKTIALLLATGISVSALGAPPQVPLTVTVQGDGVVTSVPAGITCPSDCDESYKKNSTVTLVATAYPNGGFLGWDGNCVGTQPTCEIRMKGPKTVTALFDLVEPTPPAPLLQTGQIKCWDESGVEITCAGTGQDGEYQASVAFPVPRFIDNNNGTITDQGTGLIWLKLADCLYELTWQEALDAVNNLADGQCNLSDGSNPGDWRLANIRELVNLPSYSSDLLNPVAGIPFPPFELFSTSRSCGDFNNSWWSSTTVPGGAKRAAYYYRGYFVEAVGKLRTHCAWAVKGGL